MTSRNYLVTLDGLLSRDRMALGTCVLSGPRPLVLPKTLGPSDLEWLARVLRWAIVLPGAPGVGMW